MLIIVQDFFFKYINVLQEIQTIENEKCNWPSLVNTTVNHGKAPIFCAIAKLKNEIQESWLDLFIILTSEGRMEHKPFQDVFLCDLFFFLELVTKSIVFAPKWLYKCITFSILWPCFQSFLCLTEVRMIYMGDMPHLTTCVNTVHWSSNHYLKVESEFWSIFKVVLIYIVG